MAEVWEVFFHDRTSSHLAEHRELILQIRRLAAALINPNRVGTPGRGNFERVPARLISSADRGPAYSKVSVDDEIAAFALEDVQAERIERAIAVVLGPRRPSRHDLSKPPRCRSAAKASRGPGRQGSRS